VAHAGENLLSKLRDKELRLNAVITKSLLAMVDAVRQMLGEIEITAQSPAKAFEPLRPPIKP